MLHLSSLINLYFCWWTSGHSNLSFTVLHNTKQGCAFLYFAHKKTALFISLLNVLYSSLSLV